VPNDYEIATRRFELISFLLDPSLTDAQREAAWRERCAEVSRSTLYRWLKGFREHGYLGLLPRTRSDRGETRHAGTATWVAYAIGLLYEQPDRSLTQVAIYLKNEFPDYVLSASTLRRHLHQHPAFGGIEELRSTKKKKLRSLYEASHPHEGWQLDGKGKFPVHFIDGTRVEVTVLTVLDDHSRAVLAVCRRFDRKQRSGDRRHCRSDGQMGTARADPVRSGLGIRQPCLPQWPRRAGYSPQLRQSAQPRVGRQDRGLPSQPRSLVCA
jgi:transposase